VGVLYTPDRLAAASLLTAVQGLFAAPSGSLKLRYSASFLPFSKGQSWKNITFFQRKNGTLNNFL
jgi:hypothetical protein